MNYFTASFTFILILLLSACSPHPATGVWKTATDNEYGISRLVVAFDGKAEFISTKLDSANWHCFWAAKAKYEVELDCTPSTDTLTKERFVLKINEQGLAEFAHKFRSMIVFEPVNENPAL